MAVSPCFFLRQPARKNNGGKGRDAEGWTAFDSTAALRPLVGMASGHKQCIYAKGLD